MERANPIARNLGIYHQRVQSTVVRRLSVLAFVTALAPAVASGQAVQDFIIDPSPLAAPLEKAIGYFTSTTLPSVVLGSSREPLQKRSANDGDIMCIGVDWRAWVGG